MIQVLEVEVAISQVWISGSAPYRNPWSTSEARAPPPQAHHHRPHITHANNHTSSLHPTLLISSSSSFKSSHNHMPLLRTTKHLFRTFQTLNSLSQTTPPSLPNPLFRTMSSSAMGKRLTGKTILITGASSGIGRSTALEFARTAPSNLRLILTARRDDKLKEIAEEIKKEVGDGVKVLPFKLDVSNADEVRGFVKALPEEWRAIDVLVNNAFVPLSRPRRLLRTNAN